MTDLPWVEAHSSLVARLTGAAGIAYIVINFLPGSLGGPLFDDVSTPGVLSWVKENLGSLSAQGTLGAFGMTLVAFFLLSLLALGHGRGLTATVAASSVAAMLAIDWVHAGTYFALADVGGRQSADAGIVALFSLTKSLTFADGVCFGIAAIAVSLIALEARSLPAPLCWLGMVVGAFHVIALPIQLAISAQPGGITGPISVLVVLVWILAVAIVLVIRPVSARQRLSAQVTAA
jgi:hypothetical protein